MKRNVFKLMFAAALVTMAACSGDDPEQKQPNGKPQDNPTETPVAGSVSIFGRQAADDLTRTALQADGVTLYWHKDDKLGIYSDCTSGRLSAVYGVSGDVAADGSAFFAGELGWQGETGDRNTFYAYYPVLDGTCAEDPAAVCVDVPAVQTQSADTCDHLSDLTLLVATPSAAAVPDEEGEGSGDAVAMAFYHVLPLMEFNITSIAPGFKIESIKLTAPAGEVVAVEGAALDVTKEFGKDGFAVLSGGNGSNEVTLNITGAPVVSSSVPFTAYMKICPVDLTGKTVKITVSGTQGGAPASYEFTKDGTNFLRAKKYKTALSIRPTTYLYNTKLATAAHTVATHGVMSESGYGVNERSATAFLAEASGSGHSNNWNYWGTIPMDDNTEEWAILKLQQQQPLNQVWVLPRGDNNHGEFPISFKVYASVEGGTVTRDGIDYPYDTKIELGKVGPTPNVRAADNFDGWGEPVLEVDGCYFDSQEYRKFEFPPVEAKYVKFVITRQPVNPSSLKRSSSMAELELYLSTDPVPAQPANVTNRNIAFSGDVVEVSSFKEADYLSQWSSPDRKPARMLNGVMNGMYDSWSPDPAHYNSQTVLDEWVVVHLTRRQQINRVVMNWDGVAPYDFVISVSPDMQDWTPVAEETGFTSEETSAAFDFPAEEAQYVKVNFTKINSASFGHRIYITELEAYLNE